MIAKDEAQRRAVCALATIGGMQRRGELNARAVESVRKDLAVLVEYLDQPEPEKPGVSSS